MPSGLRNTVQSHGQWELDRDGHLFQDAATFRQEWGRMQLLYVAVAAGGVLGFGGAGLCADRLGHAARRAERMEREFLAAASHELKSPLAVIITSAELLPSGGEEAKYRAQHSVRSAPDGAAGAGASIPSRLETAARLIMPAKLDTEAFLWEVYENMAAGGGKGR